MSIRNGINGFGSAIWEYCQTSLNYVGSTAASWKNLRNDISFFQKISILQKECINFFNAYRGTNQLTKLASALDSTYVTDLGDGVKTIHEWFKPINANSVHANALLDKVVDAYASVMLTRNTIARENIEEFIRPILKQFIDDLNDPSPNTGRQFGYSTSAEFLNHLRDHIKAHLSGPEDPCWNLDLAFEVGEVPLNEISWARWAANKIFNYVSAMTVVYYLKEWDLLNTAKLAANIGKLPLLGFVDKIDFFKGFKCAILLGYTGLLADAGSRLFRAIFRQNDPSLGPVAKQNAPWDTAYAALECFLYTMGIAGVFKNNPVWMALSLIAAKGVGSLGSAAKKSDIYDTPSEYGVAKPSLISRISNRAAAILSPITHQRHVAILLDKISQVAGKVLSFVGAVFDQLNELIDIEKDGFYRLYNSLIPDLCIIDTLLVMNAKGVEFIYTIKGVIIDLSFVNRLLDIIGQEALFTKMRATLGFHKEVIYATKIFTSIPNWIAGNIKKGFKLSSPLYQWNADKQVYESKWKESASWVTTLGDISYLFETTKFMRKYEIYGFDCFVEIGRKISESRIPVFGAYVKNVPILKQIYINPKNIPVVGIATIEICKQVPQIYKYVRKREGDGFDWENRCKLTANIGKIALIYWDVVESDLRFELLASVTGKGGLIKYLIGQSKAKKKFNSPLTTV